MIRLFGTTSQNSVVQILTYLVFSLIYKNIVFDLSKPQHFWT